MSKRTLFSINIADIMFAVSCCYESTARFCREYLVAENQKRGYQISIDSDSIATEQARLLCKKNRDEQLEAATPEALETLVLCRFIAEKLPKEDRVLFHGSSLTIDGEGVLFTAKSGTGKSTHTRLWREVFGDRVVMVNDDKPFLHIMPESTTIYGSPWRGKHRLGENTSAPLKAICIVCRGEENRIEPVTPKEAFPMLFQQTYTPEDLEQLRKTLVLVERLSRTVPVYRLYCNMNPQAAEVAYAGLDFNKRKAGVV